jgi:DNA-binding MarR family transcriptional regulator
LYIGIMTSPTLGTLLRRLTETLDGAVEQSYRDAGLDYRPRYTPIFRALIVAGPATLRALAESTGVTHSAIGQTVNRMAKHGLVTLAVGDDARERIVALTPHAERIRPQLEQFWAATEAAARTLDHELGVSLPGLLIQTLALLDETPFPERLRAASTPLRPNNIQ